MLAYISLACFSEFLRISDKFLISSSTSLGIGCFFLVWILTSSSKMSLDFSKSFICLKAWPLRYKALSFSGSNSKTMSRYLRIFSYSTSVLFPVNKNNFSKISSKLLIQQYTHKIQHPNIATYSEITTFSCNQTKHTIKVGNCCNFLSKRLTQKLQLFALNLPFFPSFFPDFLKNF